MRRLLICCLTRIRRWARVFRLKNVNGRLTMCGLILKVKMFCCCRVRWVIGVRIVSRNLAVRTMCRGSAVCWSIESLKLSLPPVRYESVRCAWHTAIVSGVSWPPIAAQLTLVNYRDEYGRILHVVGRRPPSGHRFLWFLLNSCYLCNLCMNLFRVMARKLLRVKITVCWRRFCSLGLRLALLMNYWVSLVRSMCLNIRLLRVVVSLVWVKY